MSDGDTTRPAAGAGATTRSFRRMAAAVLLTEVAVLLLLGVLQLIYNR